MCWRSMTCRVDEEEEKVQEQKRDSGISLVPIEASNNRKRGPSSKYEGNESLVAAVDKWQMTTGSQLELQTL